MNIDMSKIFERNPDTGEIRSREIKEPTSANIREDILSDIWAANSQVAEIIGGDNVRK